MPTRFKLIWYLCIVITVLGFVYLAAKDRMEEAMLAEERASKRSEARLKQLQNPKGQPQKIKVDPIKVIREMNALGNYEEAADLAEKVAKEFPDHAKVQTWWGISLVKLKKTQAAINHFIIAAKNDPTDEKAHLYWGLTLAMEKEFAEAIIHYRTVLEINPEHSNAYAYWGASLNALEKYEDALSKLDESIALHPLNSAAYALRVDVLYNLKRYEEAWQAVSKARDAKISIPKGSIDRLAQAFSEPLKKP
jgi:tetratricopeptide (TPR) repeat protein